jgi:hypothetical protein
MNPTTLKRASAVLLIVLIPALAATQIQARDEQEHIQKSYQLAPDASVEVSGIAGPVTIDTTAGNTAELDIVRTAPTRTDLDCGRMDITQDGASLRIRTESLCQNVRGSQRVTLKLPRRVDITLGNIAGEVHVGPTDGLLRLTSIAGHVRADELRAAKMSSLAGGLTLGIAGVGDRGIRISSVTGAVELNVRKGINAELAVRSLVGSIRSDVSHVEAAGDDGSDYRVAFGSGGHKIAISSIVGPVTIHED